MPSDDKSMEMKRIASRTAHQSMYKHCVGFVRDINAAQTWEICSGVLVQVQDKLLVATAAHCVPASPSGKVWLLPPRPKRAMDGIPAILKHDKCPNNRPDVGFLEVDRAACLSYLQTKEPFPIERLKELDVEGEIRLVILVGFPGEQVTPDEHQGMPGFSAKSLGFPTSTFHVDEWPQKLPSNAEPVDPAIDLFFEWPTDDQYTIDVNSGQRRQLPNPSGTSGGGFWDLSGASGRVWSPERAELFAIQSSAGPWPGRGNYIRAVHIIHWLRLVHENYPELRNHLEGLFPTLHATSQ